jgi:Ca2+-transporting ATPase
MNWHFLNKKEVLSELNSTESGLSQKEASLRLAKYGKNELKQIDKINPFLIFLQQFKSVFVLILLAAALFSLFIQHYIDFAVISAIVVINSAIGFLQQYKAEKTIAELREMLVPKVKVLRENKLEEISADELVPGDIVMISEGDKVMADCRLLFTTDLQTNEAVLTGESFPQTKSTKKLSLEIELADRENMLYMGTLVARGNAKAIVVETGMRTEFGKIAGLVQKIKIKKTPLEEKLDSFSKRIALIILILAAIITVVGFLRGEDPYHMTLTGIALAVSVIPEGIPAVIAITLALAIQRMHKHNALIRKLPAAETLGRVTVIATDKTGTLTEEKMTVIDAFCNNKNYKIEKANKKALGLLLKIGIMCNNARIEEANKKIRVIGDPTEKALVLAAHELGILKKEETEKEERVIEYSFSSKRKMMSIVRRRNNQLISYVKGAPDTVLKYCTKELINGQIKPLNEIRKKELHSIYEKMASRALRVLAFAYKPLAKINQETAENNLIFVGFQGMLDPPRKEVKKAIEECETAGIQVKMLTGDSLLTAEAIAKLIGLEQKSIEGHELEKFSGEDFNIAVKEKTIFARITPELKLKIIKSLKEQGEIVAVTGDGVNDILALKEAHIGVSMGIRGTDVARDVSDIILLDDNFSSIVQAVREGRRVYDNMKKSIKFHLGANVGELFIVLFALILSLPLPLLPLAILWINLVTDSLPSLALSVEKEEEDIMQRKPLHKEETILSNIWQFILVAGLFCFITGFIMFSIFYKLDLEKARTMALTTVVFYELFIGFTCRSDKSLLKIGIFSNKFLLYSVLLAILLQLAAVYTPLATVFGFEPLAFWELLLVIAASSLGFVFFEITKVIKKTNGINQIHSK